MKARAGLPGPLETPQSNVSVLQTESGHLDRSPAEEAKAASKRLQGRVQGLLASAPRSVPPARAMMKTLSSGNCTLSVPAKNSYRMVVLGASRVGKSSIVSRFLNGRFEDQYTPTIEDFHRKVYNIRGDMYQLDILDTSGNHPFPAMRRLSILTGGCRGWGGGRVRSPPAPPPGVGSWQRGWGPLARAGDRAGAQLPHRLAGIEGCRAAFQIRRWCRRVWGRGRGVVLSGEQRGASRLPAAGGGPAEGQGQSAGLSSLDIPGLCCPSEQ